MYWLIVTYINKKLFLALINILSDISITTNKFLNNMS